MVLSSLREAVLQERMDPDLKRVLERGMRLVDERTGIIQRIYELPLETNDPRLFHVAALLTDTSRYFGIQCFRHNGGAALSRERATICAIGEAVERYCAGMYNPDSLIQAREEDLGEGCVGAGQFVLFSESQYSREGFPLSRPGRETVFRWAKGWSLTRNTEVYVPACFVYVPYQFLHRSEFVTVPISTGLACGSSREEAVLRGIYEVVERDSFAITWLNRMPVPRLSIGHPRSADLGTVLERFREVGLEVCVNLATTDLGIPVVITLALDNSGAGPATVIAARADLDVEYAIMRSLEETAQTRLWAKTLMQDRQDFAPKPGFTNIVSGEDHVRLFASPDMMRHVRFLTDTPCVTELGSLDPPPPEEDAAATVGRLVDILACRGHEVIVVDVTAPDIGEVGFHVVRVLIPGLQPLDMDHNWRYLGGKRLYEVPARMGFTDRVTSEEELNPVPHPFP